MPLLLFFGGVAPCSWLCSAFVLVLCGLDSACVLVYCFLGVMCSRDLVLFLLMFLPVSLVHDIVVFMDFMCCCF